jgi:peroxiredoxin
MFALRSAVAATALLLAPALPAIAGPPAVDTPAPAFTLRDIDGKEHSLAGYKGKFVVLEWVNYDCPFVHKHYGSGNMQSLQKAFRDKGVIWLSICSSAPGKQGYFEAQELRDRIQSEEAHPTAYLIDAEGTVGRLYDAKTTPTMFVIDPEGKIVYEGAIDSKPSTDRDDIAGATNYVRAALDAALDGKPITTRTTKSYGCSVKYRK